MTRIFFIGVVLSAIACNNTVNTANKTSAKDSIKNIAADSLKKIKDTSIIDIHLKSFMDTLKPIFGYRFVVVGDFDGDGNKDTLTEHFKSKLDNKESCKYYSNLDYDKTVDLTEQKQPYCYISSSSKKVDSLFISDNTQLLGLAFLHNEGDLDGNGTDEISYVVNWADWSSVNSCHIMTFTKTGWVELYKFSMHDWELPPTPETSTSFGLFGADGVNHYEKNDTLNDRLENDLRTFSFIRKIKNRKIEVSEMKMDDDGNDSTIVGDQIKKIVYLKK